MSDAFVLLLMLPLRCRIAMAHEGRENLTRFKPGGKMRTLITLAIVLFCLQLWAQRYNQETTLIDSVYAIPALDGDITADSLGIPISLMNWSYDILIGDIGNSGNPSLVNGSVRGYLSFPLPTFPDGYSLVNSTIRLYQYTSRGKEILGDSTVVYTYFPHWDIAGGDTIKCIISHVNYGSSLDLGDWAKGDEGNTFTYNPNVGEITWEGIDEPGNHGEAGYRYLDVTDCVLHDLSISNISSQYRIAFQINTDYDYGPDFVAFLSANSNPEYPEFLPIMFFSLYNPSSVSEDNSPAVLVNVASSPNPFSSQVTFNISLKSHAELSIKLHDLKGRVLKELGSTPYSKGTHNISIDTHDLSSGIYLLQVKAGSEIITKKITCLK